jgi:hypothetical protein
MGSNVTLKLDDSLLKHARKAAVDDDLSLSAWVTKLIVEKLRKLDDRRVACRKALAALETGFKLNPGRFTREEIHER